jgi:hypothetical protein
VEAGPQVEAKSEVSWAIASGTTFICLCLPEGVGFVGPRAAHPSLQSPPSSDRRSSDGLPHPPCCLHAYSFFRRNLGSTLDQVPVERPR